ncbi:MAG TPA: rhodanese-like domain-containing protein [Thermoanaerobaculia bacterium]|nr:rhodanese-like domain-containing protein [Thermoanaerobaculia bacterium]
MTDQSLEITPARLEAMRDSGEALHLVDVRAPWEHEIAAIEGDVLIPLGELEGRTHELERGRTVVLYCHHGARSWVAARALRAAGWEAVSLAGGIERWALEIDRSMRRY